jgi:23S rRNA (adenine2503-C2)-methyltransferase
MELIGKVGKADLATVYIAEFPKNRYAEFVESVQPPFPRLKKWVIIVSVMSGCPIQCRICDAGGGFTGMFSAEEIFAQIDYIIDKRFSGRTIPVEKFKIHFARMGEPSLNENLLQVLRQLPGRYKYRSLMPCISTIAPRGTDEFFDDLMHIKSELYHGTFQLQFSIHSTDEKERDYLMPVKKWHLSQIAQYGERFYQKGDRKIGLNFALAEGSSFEPGVIAEKFDPDKFLIKITPLNPTHTAAKNNLSSFIDAYQGPGQCDAIDQLREIGFEVLLSIGETQEDQIGSNCGQYIRRHLENHRHIENAYIYDVDTP